MLHYCLLLLGLEVYLGNNTPHNFVDTSFRKNQKLIMWQNQNKGCFKYSNNYSYHVKYEVNLMNKIFIQHFLSNIVQFISVNTQYVVNLFLFHTWYQPTSLGEGPSCLTKCQGASLTFGFILGFNQIFNLLYQHVLFVFQGSYELCTSNTVA